MDRCHRIGQTKPVHVYRLATANSVEVWLRALKHQTCFVSPFIFVLPLSFSACLSKTHLKVVWSAIYIFMLTRWCLLDRVIFFLQGRIIKRAFSKLKLEHVVIGKGQFQQDRVKPNTLEV
jgi:hypothetical protein